MARLFDHRATAAAAAHSRCAHAATAAAAAARSRCAHAATAATAAHRLSISGIRRAKAQWVSPSVQVNINHCARFVFLSRAIDETDSSYTIGFPARTIARRVPPSAVTNDKC